MQRGGVDHRVRAVQRPRQQRGVVEVADPVGGGAGRRSKPLTRCSRASRMWIARPTRPALPVTTIFSGDEVGIGMGGGREGRV